MKKKNKKNTWSNAINKVGKEFKKMIDKVGGISKFVDILQEGDKRKIDNLIKDK